MAAFSGDISAAPATGLFAGEEFGFAFRSDKASTDDSYAQIGRTRNGVFL